MVETLCKKLRLQQIEIERAYGMAGNALMDYFSDHPAIARELNETLAQLRKIDPEYPVPNQQYKPRRKK